MCGAYDYVAVYSVFNTLNNHHQKTVNKHLNFRSLKVKYDGLAPEIPGYLLYDTSVNSVSAILFLFLLLIIIIFVTAEV